MGEMENAHKLQVCASNMKHTFLPLTYILHVKIKGFMGKTVGLLVAVRLLVTLEF